MESKNNFSQFNFWFTPRCDGDYTIWDFDRNMIGTISKLAEDDEDYDQICLDYGAYTRRAEWLVGQRNLLENPSNYSPESAKDVYKQLLTGVAAIRAYKNGANPDDAICKISKTLDWLETTDFYECPASTIYHESHPHGLLYHTLKVVQKIKEVARIDTFCKLVNIEDTVLVALTHDWCKIGLYEKYMRNQKNKDGIWEQVPSYRRKDFVIPMGHGASSMWLASKCFRLSESEAMALRWHMGRWNVADNEMNELQQANEEYPLVHMLQFADQLAITKY